jgi:cob(I)alamin adenosyltransferase
MRIYTKTGDSGETGLFDGTRVSKADPRVDAYGCVDELGAWIGLVRSNGTDEDLDAALTRIQRDLFAMGSLLADPTHKISARVDKAVLGDEDIHRLEHLIDTLELGLPPLRRFILAGGSPVAAHLHVARAVCRRAERVVIALGPREPGDPCIQYLNRLGDLLFVMARAANHRAGVPEVEW